MKNNRLINYKLLILVVLLSFFCCGNVFAKQKLDEEFYCSLCKYKDSSNPMYEKERQFYYKIKSIKEKYGRSIDEVALAAAVLHRYNDNETAYTVNYDKDFDSDRYKSALSRIKEMYSNDQDLSSSDVELVSKNENIDLLTVAAIVMIDSNHNGVYSDVCFKKGLAGTKLIGNDMDDSNYFSKMLSSILNKAVCEKVKNEKSEYSDSKSSVVYTSEFQKIVNIDNVCANGYIGGLYPEVRKIKDEKLKQDVKDNNADEIIELANYYRELYGSGAVEYSDGCAASLPGSTGAFASWRQFDPKWSEITLGGVPSLGNAGCLVTSISMQIARSGTKIGSLPSGYSEFDPGAFVTSLNEHDGFAGGGNYAWTGFQTIAPNWGIGDFISLNESSNMKLAEVVSRELSSGFGAEQYQKFLVLQIHHSSSSQHWVAVNGVENGMVTIFDPASDGTTLDDNYDNWVVDGYRVMYAKDVANGQIGNTNNNDCIGDSGEGEIQIPSEYGNGGYTVTEIDVINWDKTADLYPIYEKWLAAGGQYDDGIAVLDGRYLIACTTTFGNTGDSVDFYLENGTKIPALIFDTKNPNDSGCNKWGHDDGANVIEFEVSSNAFRNQYGENPGNNGWHMEWAGSRVASATNLGEGVVPADSSTASSSSKGAYCKNGVGYGTYKGGRSGSKIADLAVRVTPIASPEDAKSAPNAYPWTPPATGAGYTEYLDFERIMYETVGKYPSHDPSNPNSTGDGYNNCAYGSCAQAAGAIIRATVDPDFSTGCPCAELAYLQKNTEKWQLAGEVTAGQDRASVCQPGDLLVTCGDSAPGNCATGSGHVMIYVGNALARTKFPNTNADVFEAAYGGSYSKYPRLSDRTDDRTFQIYRPTGRGEFYYPFIDIEAVLAG